MKKEELKFTKAIFVNNLPFNCDDYLDWFLDADHEGGDLINNHDIVYQYENAKSDGDVYCDNQKVFETIEKLYHFITEHKVDVILL